ncbi:O-linked N-acetylglucosamine transferase family protein [Burkholderia alba]|uniref:O-linked N-acetylglucosamine transferase family protein n=1 Tax=Burkholderia alba TaxID=2683677 RepID=UPI002B0588EF|nr:tetratricopeptide repeat protein [Burkholderia alba]
MSFLPEPTSAPLTPEQQQAADIALVLQSAIEQQQQGALGDAQALYEAILDAQPDHSDARYRLGTLKVQAGAPAEAIAHFEIALGLAPNHPGYWINYINTLTDDGQIAAAWTAVTLAQQRGVAGQALNLMIARLSNSAEGRPSPLQFVEVASTAAPAASPAVDDGDGAAPAQADTRRPSPQEVNRIATLASKQRYVEAAKAARLLTQRYPAYGMGWRLLSVALFCGGEYGQALDALTRTVALLPDDLECRMLLADTLRVSNRLPEAEAQCRQTLALAPDHAGTHRVLCITLGGLGRLDEAIRHGRRAIELAPHVADMHSTLAVTMFEGGLAGESEAHFRRAIELNPKDAPTHSNLLFSLTHKIGIDVATLVDAHRDFAQRHAAPLRARWPRHANRRDPDRKLRIGFVSGDLFQHAVASYLLPLLVHLSKDPGLSLHFYHNHVIEDHVTLKLRAYADEWRIVTNLDDEQLCNQIRSDRIDILLDLSGHTGRNRLLALARKPAPVQISHIGYPATTGLDAVDYYFADRFALPFGPLEQQFTEKIVHLPASATFEPERNAPPVNILPAQHNGYLTFGSFNRLNKLRPDVIATWARLLHALPTARIALGAIPPQGGEETLIGWFEQAGIARERLTFLPRSATAVYLQQHHQVDICLDTFPYTGSTTVLHSLWMGVPTLTIAGETLPSRAGSTWMSHVGLEAFVARDLDDFVAKGIAAASDLDALARIRTELRGRCAATPAFKPDVIAHGLADAFRIMWRRWCDGQPPASFTVPPRDSSDGEPS